MWNASTNLVNRYDRAPLVSLNKNELAIFINRFILVCLIMIKIIWQQDSKFDELIDVDFFPNFSIYTQC